MTHLLRSVAANIDKDLCNIEAWRLSFNISLFWRRSIGCFGATRRIVTVRLFATTVPPRIYNLGINTYDIYLVSAHASLQQQQHFPDSILSTCLKFEITVFVLRNKSFRSWLIPYLSARSYVTKFPRCGNLFVHLTMNSSFTVMGNHHSGCLTNEKNVK